MFFGTQTESSLPGADNDTGAVSFTSRRFYQAGAESWRSERGRAACADAVGPCRHCFVGETAPSSD